jgi:hypothetical protein
MVDSWNSRDQVHDATYLLYMSHTMLCVSIVVYSINGMQKDIAQWNEQRPFSQIVFVCKYSSVEKNYTSFRTMSTCWITPLSDKLRKSHFLTTRTCTTVLTSWCFSLESRNSSVATNGWHQHARHLGATVVTDVFCSSLLRYHYSNGSIACGHSNLQPVTIVHVYSSVSFFVQDYL